MILDTIENAGRYLHLGDGISHALNYISNNDLSKVNPGRYEIDNDRLVMNVFEFEPDNLNESRLEGHRRYIDLQFWVHGTELMGHEILGSQPVLEPYNGKTDCVFHECQASFSRLLPGMFVIYYPSDLHTAILNPQSKETVKKIVFKILVEA
ncbi:MAG TPA: YhcH/YjgK/YiaL family protein [Prolixibacteraceae bacterium]|nr:YhcH/YjgK/YiaL family protein [Prolixibacteraceae bacterium]